MVRFAILRHFFAISGVRDLHHGHHGRRLFARHHDGIRILLFQGVHMFRGKRGNEVDFTRFKRRHLRHRIFDHANVHPVDMRLTFDMVAIKTVHDQMIIGYPLYQLERATTHHGPCFALFAGFELIFRGGIRRVQHEARAISGHHVQEERIGLFHVHFDRQRIDDVHGFHSRIKTPHTRFGLRIHEAVNAKLNGIGIYCTAIVKFHAVFQLEHPGQMVIGEFPRFRSIAHELTVGRDIDQAAANVHGYPHHLVARCRMEIEMGDLVAISHSERAAAFRFCHGNRHHKRQDAEQCKTPYQPTSLTHNYHSSSQVMLPQTACDSPTDRHAAD